MQLRIWENQGLDAIYLEGLRDGITVGHDLILNQYPGDEVLNALKQILALAPEQFADIAHRGGEPIIEGRYTSAAAALIREKYRR